MWRNRDPLSPCTRSERRRRRSAALGCGPIFTLLSERAVFFCCYRESEQNKFPQNNESGGKLFFPARLNTSLFDVLLFTSHTLLFFFFPLLAHHKKVQRVNILSPFSRPGGPKPSVPVRAVGFIVIEHMLAVFL